MPSQAKKQMLQTRPIDVGDLAPATQGDGVRADLARTEQATPIAIRTLNVVGASFLLVLLSPLLGLTALSIKLVSHGPNLFTQPRHSVAG